MFLQIKKLRKFFISANDYAIKVTRIRGEHNRKESNHRGRSSRKREREKGSYSRRDPSASKSSRRRIKRTKRDIDYRSSEKPLV